MNTASRTRSLAVAAIALLLSAAPSTLVAQERSAPIIPPPGAALTAPAASSLPLPAPTSASPVGPLAQQGTLDPPGTGEDEYNFRQGRRGDRNVRWMIVGGGLFLGGMIIGDDVGTVLSISGLVIGGIGLYRYLQ